MRWKDFDPLFDNKLKSNPPPDYLVVYLGSNDLGNLCEVELIHTIKCSLLRCKVLVPGMTFIWSDMLPRLYWHNAQSASKIDATRKAVNRAVKQFLRREGGLVIRHPTITFSQKQLFRYDSTHLNELGNAAFLNSLQGALKPWCVHHQTSLYSQMINKY